MAFWLWLRWSARVRDAFGKRRFVSEHSLRSCACSSKNCKPRCRSGKTLWHKHVSKGISPQSALRQFPNRCSTHFDEMRLLLALRGLD